MYRICRHASMEVMAKTAPQTVTNATLVMPGSAFDSDHFEHFAADVKKLTSEQIETTKGNIEVMAPKGRPPWMKAFTRCVNRALKVKQLRSTTCNGVVFDANNPPFPGVPLKHLTNVDQQGNRLKERTLVTESFQKLDVLMQIR